MSLKPIRLTGAGQWFAKDRVVYTWNKRGRLYSYNPVEEGDRERVRKKQVGKYSQHGCTSKAGGVLVLDTDAVEDIAGVLACVIMLG